jgi:hypothetical protein
MNRAVVVLRANARCGRRHFERSWPQEKLNALVSSLYLCAGKAERKVLAERTVLAWMLALNTNNMGDRDVFALLVRLAVDARDLDGLLSFKLLLDHVVELECDCMPIDWDDDDPDEEDYRWTVTKLEAVILGSLDLRIAFPDLSTRVASWATKHDGSYLFAVLDDADNRGLVGELPPSFVDDLKAVRYTNNTYEMLLVRRHFPSAIMVLRA